MDVFDTARTLFVQRFELTIHQRLTRALAMGGIEANEKPSQWMAQFYLQARSVPHGTEKTVCDAWNGYHSVPLHPDDRHLTTFITSTTHYYGQTPPSRPSGRQYSGWRRVAATGSRRTRTSLSSGKTTLSSPASRSRVHQSNHARRCYSPYKTSPRQRTSPTSEAGSALSTRSPTPLR